MFSPVESQVIFLSKETPIVNTVKKHLQKINETKSQGSDSIHPKLLKETIESITTPVAKIYQ
jgi:hypothetical protein